MFLCIVFFFIILKHTLNLINTNSNFPKHIILTFKKITKFRFKIYFSKNQFIFCFIKFFVYNFE